MYNEIQVTTKEVVVLISQNLSSRLYYNLGLGKPLVVLLARCWVGWAFLGPGWMKITSWQTTLMLFHSEFQVLWISPIIAAYLATAAEIILPILLIIGLGGRFTALALFLFNVVAMFSYPYLWTPDGAQGLTHHINWGVILALLTCYDLGPWSLDHYLAKVFGWRQ